MLFVDSNHDIKGNQDLKAEHSNNFNASVTWSKPRPKGTWRAELGGFYNDIDDLITLAAISGTLYSYINIGNYRTLGGTAGVGFESDRWTVTLGGNLLGRRDDVANDIGGDYLWSNEARFNVAHNWSKLGLRAQVFFK